MIYFSHKKRIFVAGTYALIGRIITEFGSSSSSSDLVIDPDTYDDKGFIINDPYYSVILKSIFITNADGSADSIDLIVGNEQDVYEEIYLKKSLSISSNNTANILDFPLVLYKNDTLKVINQQNDLNIIISGMLIE